MSLVSLSRPGSSEDMLRLRGLFGLPGLDRPRDWLKLKHQTLNCCHKLVDKILSGRADNVLHDFDNLSDTLCKVLDAAELARNVSPDSAHVDASEGVLRELSHYMQELNSDDRLYDALLQQQNASTSEERELLRSLQRDFALRGGILSLAARNRVLSLQNEITEWSIRVSTVLKNAEQAQKNRKQRAETTQEAWRVLISLLNRRHDLARMLSYPSYAHLVAMDKLLNHPEIVRSFLGSISALINEAHGENRDRQKIPAQPRRDPLFGKIQSYLGVDQVFNTLSSLLEELFGVRLQKLQFSGHESHVWHSSVLHTLVIDAQNGGQLGEVYFDLFAREGKLPGAAHYALRGSRQLEDGSFQIPCAAIVCDFPRSIHASGMHHYQLETLLHEFGHVLHTIMSRTSFQHLSGTRGPLDFVEIPSHLMEHFAWDPRWMRKFAPHAPSNLLQELAAAKKDAILAELQLQAPFAALDLALHSHGHFGWGSEAQSTIKSLMRQAAQSYEPNGLFSSQDTFPCMPHIVGYGGCYYSYILARVLAAEIWHHLFRNPELSLSRAGDILRWRCLRLGASKDTKYIMSDLLAGSTPTFKGIAEELGMFDSEFATMSVLLEQKQWNLHAEPST